ncbi:2OG-Fe(II) oxygenase [Rhodoferax sp.]|uniref:2OG-Fe(II) oxygenase n=1 Tax=Rhodoferax sp. TaxID=50421 RepID=UPI00260B8DF6|nr:2OG-Fe(II) oxygenase [Rhodoferax sp.]MDD2924641.1 2OG-Fe(II) oxygenase [Rhodoferax sp.]
MNNPSALSPQWRAWLDENLARGCSQASLLDTMVETGISPSLATAELQQALTRGTAGVTPATPPTPQAYVYESPRLPQSGNVIHTQDRDVHVTMRLARPVIAVLDDFMSPDECDQLVELARLKLKRSAIVDPASGQEKVIDARSSYGTFFYLNENDFITRLDRRIAELMHWPVENGEGIQILHYPVGAEYKAHFDYFPPEDPGSLPHLAKGGQRVSTLVMYLNDVQEGGETTFPSVQLSVTPKKGSAAYFEYCNSLGQVDPLSLHSGVPVVAGEKWIATKWMRQQRYNP